MARVGTAKVTVHIIGIEITRFHLDAFCLEDETEKRFDNTPHGHCALINWLGAFPVARVVYEPAEPYHRAVENALSDKFQLVKVNPLQARRFAQACVTHAKADAIDARMLARIGVSLALEPNELLNEKLHDIRELQIARTALVIERTRLLSLSYVQTNSVLKHHTKASLALVERQIVELNAEIAKLVAEDEQAAPLPDQG